MNQVVTIDYTNWRGERRKRKIIPWMLVFKNTKWHPGEQWILEATDMEGPDREIKDFAMTGIHEWEVTE